MLDLSTPPPTPRALSRRATVPIIVSLRALPFPTKVNEQLTIFVLPPPLFLAFSSFLSFSLPLPRYPLFLSLADVFTRRPSQLVGAIKGTYVIRDTISGEYLPLTIGQFHNILPDDDDDGDEDKIVASSWP